MPSYNASPFAAIPQKMEPGRPSYLFGSWNRLVSPTKLHVSKVAITSNVATLTVVINEGNVPAVGSLISVQGTATASGAFNVTNVALTGVSLDTSGSGTVTFALTHADVASTADAGTAIVPQPEVGETVADGKSVAAGLPYATPFTPDGVAKTVVCEVNFPTVPTACVVALQGSLTNIDANFVPVITNVVTVSTGTATVGTLTYTGNFNFYRYAISGTSGSGTIVAKLGIA